MAKLPIQPLKPPVAFEHGSGFGETTPAKTPSGETAPTPPKKTKDLATSTHGKRDHSNGAMVYKTGGGMVRASRLLAMMARKNPPPQDGTENAAESQE